MCVAEVDKRTIDNGLRGRKKVRFHICTGVCLCKNMSVPGRSTDDI